MIKEGILPLGASACRTTTAWYIRWGVADALSKIGDKRALEPLRRLKDDDDIYVQRAGKEVIEKIQANNSNNAA